MGPIDVVPGTLELLLLKTLSRGQSMHGFELMRWLRDATDGELLVEEGALYPALHRLERRRWIKGEWAVSEKGRRAKYYSLTGGGRQELRRAEQQWLRYLGAWQKIALAAVEA
jgi:PadR family transcriptional regulator, regulatory protein PadR